jgi:D-alanine-D-alanine ligase
MNGFIVLKNNKRIVIVRSRGKGLSSMSKESSDAAVAVLKKHFAHASVCIINSVSDLETLLAMDPDLVLLGMEFVPASPELGIADPNKIWLSDFLDEHGIAYTGSSQPAHELARNKPQAKQSILDAGLNTAAYSVIKQDQLFTSADITLKFPLFAKPSNRGGGLGIDSTSVVYNFDQLRLKVGAISTKYEADTLVEQYLPGREFSVALLKDEDDTQLLALPIELIAPPNDQGTRLLSSKVKSANSEEARPVIDGVIRASVTTLAKEAFNTLGGRDYGRIDIRLDNNGEAHFLEANLIPSLISGYGSFPKACALNLGLDYEPMILRIIDLGLARDARREEHILEPEILPTPIFTSPEVALGRI